MKINNLIKILTFSDIIVVSGWGLVSPLIAIFISGQIKGGNLELVGLSTAVYLVTRSILQMPFARLIDKRKGEIDDFIVMAVGSFMVCSTAFLYIFSSTAVHILLLQLYSGLGAAMTLPGWYAIFTRHIDKNKEAEEWSFYNAFVGLGGALAGALGGFLAEKMGFRPLFLLVGIICTFGTSFLFFVYQDLRMEEKRYGR